MSNRLLFWNKVWFDHTWLEQYIYREIKDGDITEVQ
jgi:hypothetical protein